MHRRNELGTRLNIFWDKCDRAVDDINKIKVKVTHIFLVFKGITTVSTIQHESREKRNEIYLPKN